MDREVTSELPNRKAVKSMWMDFLGDFREYLTEYVRENVYELLITEIPIRGQVKLFDGLTQGKVKIKNQGENFLFLSTTGQGGYRLAPEESIEFFLNSQLIATTISGTTTVAGFIRS